MCSELAAHHGCDHDHCRRYRESGLALVRGDDSHLGNFWAFRHIVRPTMLEAWWQEDVAACLMPFYLNSMRANKAQGHPRSAAATRHPSKSATSSYEHEAKNPQFRIDTEQPGAFDYLFKLRDYSIGQFAALALTATEC